MLPVPADAAECHDPRSAPTAGGSWRDRRSGTGIESEESAEAQEAGQPPSAASSEQKCVGPVGARGIAATLSN